MNIISQKTQKHNKHSFGDAIHFIINSKDNYKVMQNVLIQAHRLT